MMQKFRNDQEKRDRERDRERFKERACNRTIFSNHLHLTTLRSAGLFYDKTRYTHTRSDLATERYSIIDHRTA